LVAALPLLVAFLTTYLLVPPVRRFATEWRLGDKPNGRKLHAQAIPHLGGIAIFGGFFLALLVLLATPFGVHQAARVLALLPGLLIVFGLGMVDDLRGLRASVKLAYQLLGAVCIVSMGAGLAAIGLPDTWVAVLAGASVLWYVGVCNGVNLIDGLDGLAAGVAAIAALGFAAVGAKLGDGAVVLVAVSLIGALLAFLRFNFHPARIFMGDTGSMFIGFTLAFLTCLLASHVGLWNALLGGATILGLPILDTASAICRRLVGRRHIFQADDEHTHHRLMHVGLSHRGSVLVLYLVSALFAWLGSGVLLGQRMLFPWACALGLGLPLALALLSRRAPVRRVQVLPAPSEPPVRLPLEADLQSRVVSVTRSVKGRREAEVLAEVPPAASSHP
jgi:UDP-GlcNAc:undecaprenyl-phosphate GlcNAc-1-phosphate transferase